MLIRLLPVLELPISLVNQVVAGSDVIVPVVLDALLSVLPVKIVLSQQFLKELVVYGHLLLAREQAHVSIPVFDLERPCVISDFVNTESSIWVCIQYSSNQIFTLTR